MLVFTLQDDSQHNNNPRYVLYSNRYNTKYFNDPAAGGGTFTPNPPHTPQLDKWATGPGSIIFERFYSGNPVCSPTRAALLSGRTPFRDCIRGANEQQPFPAITPTIAQQVKKVGYRTVFIGKWHLGCLYGECLDWELGPYNTTSVNKWKSANPANLGFDEYHATIAVTPTSTTNCGCNPEWALQDKGCIAGGGKYVKSILSTMRRCDNALLSIKPSLTWRTRVLVFLKVR